MIKIGLFSDYAPIRYACEELKKYLSKMMPNEDVCLSLKSDSSDFRLGLMQDIGLDVSDAQDVRLDDILYVDTTERGGIIAGSNPRSVLLAVYEFLRQNGCRWYFPGSEGELVPQKAIKGVSYRHAPDMRYRGPCIEGAVNQRIILDTIEFLPKVGFNLFMSQFETPTVFYDRYYDDAYNTEIERAPIEPCRVAEYKREFEKEVTRRGLQYHDMGHGWCTLPFGVEGADRWSPKVMPKMPDENRKYFAMVGGVRDFFKGPLSTQFCMSNPAARNMVVNYICDFAKEHSTVNMLHVWLADSHNNHCECEECLKRIPSDWYMIFLNELDGELTKRELDTKIAFSAYNDTIYPPKTERLNNPKRFSFMMGPINRSYTATLTGESAPVKEYERNNIIMPETLDEYMEYYRAWMDVLECESFFGEYHFWRFQTLDFSGLYIAKRIYEDIRFYRGIGARGMVACGSLRSYFPTGFAYYVYARALFDERITFEELKSEYFSFAFGKNASECLSYLEKIGELFDFEYMMGKRSLDPTVSIYYNPTVAEKMGDVGDICDKMKTFIDNITPENDMERVSVMLLGHHTDYMKMIAEIVGATALYDKTLAREKYELMKDEMSKREPELLRYFDHWLNVAYVERIFRTEDKFW